MSFVHGAQKLLILGSTGFLGESIRDEFSKLKIPTISATRREPSKDGVYFQISDAGRLRNIMDSYDVGAVLNLLGNTKSRSQRGLSGLERKQLFGQFTDVLPYLINSEIRVIHVGSSAEYGVTEFAKESDICEPMNSYGKGKLVETRFFTDLRDKGVDSVVLRPSVVFGKNGTGDMLVPSIVNQLDRGIAPRIDNPDSVVDFLYSTDFASAVASAYSKRKKLPPILNVGPGYGTSVGTFSNLVVEAYRDKLGERGLGSHDVSRYKLAPQLDTTLIYETLGWKASYGLVEGIAEMIAD